jgi:hypothetical protein
VGTLVSATVSFDGDSWQATDLKILSKPDKEQKKLAGARAGTKAKFLRLEFAPRGKVWLL